MNMITDDSGPTSSWGRGREGGGGGGGGGGEGGGEGGEEG